MSDTLIQQFAMTQQRVTQEKIRCLFVPRRGEAASEQLFGLADIRHVEVDYYFAPWFGVLQLDDAPALVEVLLRDGGDGYLFLEDGRHGPVHLLGYQRDTAAEVAPGELVLMYFVGTGRLLDRKVGVPE